MLLAQIIQSQLSKISTNHIVRRIYPNIDMTLWIKII